MLRTQMDAIHPHCYPFLIVRFFSLQFSNIECLWVGWYHISSVLGIWLWPNQKHKQTQISTGTNDPIPWPHISSLLQPVINRTKCSISQMNGKVYTVIWLFNFKVLRLNTMCYMWALNLFTNNLLTYFKCKTLWIFRTRFRKDKTCICSYIPNQFWASYLNNFN